MSNEEKNAESKSYKKINTHYTGLDNIKSIYLWGDPGCGKSFILETLFNSLDLKDADKVFLHYQEFMLKVH